MFSLSEIAKLQAAGYSLDDILAANTPDEDPAPAQPADPAPAQPADPAPAQPADPAPAQPADPAPAHPADSAPAPDPMSAMTAKLDELISAIRAGNIKAGGFQPPVSPEDAVDQVIANIINPPTAKGRK